MGQIAITHITEKVRTMQDVMDFQLLEQPDLMISSDTVRMWSRIVPQRSTHHVMQHTSDESARNTTLLILSYGQVRHCAPIVKTSERKLRLLLMLLLLSLLLLWLLLLR